MQERGKLKEEEFVKKIQEMMTEEEKQRIPIAQGLPWTTDEPEVRSSCYLCWGPKHKIPQFSEMFVPCLQLL